MNTDTYQNTTHSRDHVRLHMTYHTRGKESARIHRKTHQSQFWYDVSYDQARCETYFVLSTYHASGCVGESVCAASHCCGARNAPLYATKKKLEMHLLAKRCKKMCGGPRKTHYYGFWNCGSNHHVNLSEPCGAYGSLDTPRFRIPSLRIPARVSRCHLPVCRRIHDNSDCPPIVLRHLNWLVMMSQLFSFLLYSQLADFELHFELLTNGVEPSCCYS